MQVEGKEIKPRPFITFRRIAWSVVGITWFLWIGYEDRGLTPILIVSGVIAFASGLETYASQRDSKYQGRIYRFVRGIGVGILSGALVGPITFLLASLKTSLHQHEVADFTMNDLILLLDRIPIWTLAGAMFGTAASILEWSRTTEERKDPQL